jgi:hypothetical protein
VAEKVMGFIKLPFPGTPKFQKPTEDGVIPLYYVPNYSTNISAAWEVVEKDRGEASALLKSPIHGGYFFTYKHERAFGETAPLAICRAALFTVEK